MRYGALPERKGKLGVYALVHLVIFDHGACRIHVFMFYCVLMRYFRFGPRHPSAAPSPLVQAWPCSRTESLRSRMQDYTSVSRL